MSLDPLLEMTASQQPRVRAKSWRKSEKELRKARRPSRFQIWAFTDTGAYRLERVMGYGFAIYFGISAFIAGIPTFDLTAPDGWTPIWSAVLIISGPIGLVGTWQNTPKFWKIELAGAFPMAGSLTVYAAAMLFLAYGPEGSEGRIAAGAGFSWLAAPAIIHCLLLVVKIISERKAS
jgi:hypothetical protein